MQKLQEPITEKRVNIVSGVRMEVANEESTLARSELRKRGRQGNEKVLRAHKREVVRAEEYRGKIERFGSESAYQPRNEVDPDAGIREWQRSGKPTSSEVDLLAAVATDSTSKRGWSGKRKEFTSVRGRGADEERSSLDLSTRVRDIARTSRPQSEGEREKRYRVSTSKRGRDQRIERRYRVSTSERGRDQRSERVSAEERERG